MAIHIFKESTEPDSLGNKFRQKRMLLFFKLIENVPKPIQILDIGGNQIFWVNAGVQNNLDFQITLLNLNKQKASFPNITSVIGDATDMGQFSTNQFDLVFSNSVIEHLGSKTNQRKMANEAQRVGERHFIQTPNKYFFLEPHYLLPFFQFLPKPIQYNLLVNTKLSRFKRWRKDLARQYVNEVQLLSLKEMKRHFPTSKIWREKFLGMNKSFVAHNF